MPSASIWVDGVAKADLNTQFFEAGLCGFGEGLQKRGRELEVPYRPAQCGLNRVNAAELLDSGLSERARPRRRPLSTTGWTGTDQNESQ